MSISALQMSISATQMSISATQMGTLATQMAILTWVTGILTWVTGILTWVTGILTWVTGILTWVTGVLRDPSVFFDFLSRLIKDLTRFLTLLNLNVVKYFKQILFNIKNVLKNLGKTNTFALNSPLNLNSKKQNTT